MASLTEVAQRAGVSLATASIVLNPGKQENRISEQCAKRVRKVAIELGYVPNYHAQSMKRGRAEAIALVIDMPAQSTEEGHPMLPLSGMYWGTLLGAVELSLRKLGYAMVIVGPDERMNALDKGILGVKQRRFDGLIVMGSTILPDRFGFLQEWSDVPVVVVEAPMEGVAFPTIEWDEPAAVRMALAHMKDLGHKDLLWVGPGPKRYTDQPLSREKTIVPMAREMGLRLETLRLTADWNMWGEWVDQAQAIVEKYLREHARPKFTGVVAYNDITGIGVCGALQGAGLRVPEDISVIGFDDHEAAFSIPRLTTVSHEVRVMGEKAVDLAMRMLENHGSRQELRRRIEVVEPRMVMRKSTGPVRQA